MARSASQKPEVSGRGCGKGQPRPRIYWASTEGRRATLVSPQPPASVDVCLALPHKMPCGQLPIPRLLVARPGCRTRSWPMAGGQGQVSLPGWSTVEPGPTSRFCRLFLVLLLPAWDPEGPVGCRFWRAVCKVGCACE